MMDVSSNRVLRWLVIQVKPAVADFYKYVSFTSQYGVEDDLTSKEFFVEIDTLIDIRGKDMNVMNVTNQN